jgi:hypothetical protein
VKARHAQARLAVALAVLTAHLALLLWWLQADRLSRTAPAVLPRVAVRLIALPAPAPAPAAPREATPRRRPVAMPSRSDRAPTAAAPTPLAITVAPAPEPQASEPKATEPVAEPRPSLMDGEATRRAIRAAARDPGLAAQAGRQGPALQTPDERLGERVQRSAKGNCLKGEYLGGGMGLLSLPFLAAAALNDQCRR